MSFLDCLDRMYEREYSKWVKEEELEEELGPDYMKILQEKKYERDADDYEFHG